MSTNQLARIDQLKQLIQKTEPDFKKLAQIHGAVTFERECSFALQILKNNSYLADAAAANPDSLKFAILNCASIGLSLSPAQKLAYLIPRKINKVLSVVFAPSYQGIKKLATDAGAIQWCKAEIIYQNDTFQEQGFTKEPTFKRQVFGDRGEVVGGFCVARLANNDFMTEVMPIAEIKQIAEKSEAFKQNAGPWAGTETEWGEMVKKTLIIRAGKSWPHGKGDRLAQALDLSNQGEPAPLPTGSRNSDREELVAFLRDGIRIIGRSEERYLSHLKTVLRREVKSMDDLTDIELTHQKPMMEDWLKQHEAKLQREMNENAK